jgi:hypothetical protein
MGRMGNAVRAEVSSNPNSEGVMDPLQPEALMRSNMSAVVAGLQLQQRRTRTAIQQAVHRNETTNFIIYSLIYFTLYTYIFTNFYLFIYFTCQPSFFSYITTPHRMMRAGNISHSELAYKPFIYYTSCRL